MPTVFCIGRNYVKHAQELKNAVPEEPVVFLKPETALCPSGSRVKVDAAWGRIDPEGELVVRVGPDGQTVDAVTAGIDFTARDFQDQAKKRGLCWTLAKGIDGFAPLGAWVSLADLSAAGFELNDLPLEVTVGGVSRQKARTSEMIFSIATILEYLRRYFTLRPGDLIFTGTPAGVAGVEPGEEVVVQLANGLARVIATLQDTRG